MVPPADLQNMCQRLNLQLGSGCRRNCYTGLRTRRSPLYSSKISGKSVVSGNANLEVKKCTQRTSGIGQAVRQNVDIMSALLLQHVHDVTTREIKLRKRGKKLASLQAEFKGTMEVPLSQIALELTALS